MRMSPQVAGGQGEESASLLPITPGGLQSWLSLDIGRSYFLPAYLDH